MGAPKDPFLYTGDTSTKLRSFHCPVIFSLCFSICPTHQGKDSHLLSHWAPGCPAQSTHGFVMQKVPQRVPSVQQQKTQTFLNETSQTQRHIPAKSVGRYKLFHCVPDCQEEFCKCSNEVWTAPRQGCQKLIPDDLQYRSSSSSVVSAKLLEFASFFFRN